MLKRLRTRRPVLFCICAEIFFLLIMMLGVYAVAFGALFFGIDVLSIDSYALTFLQELFGAAVALFFLFRTGRQALLTRRGTGFFDGLLVGMYPLALICYSFVVGLLMNRPADAPLRSPVEIFTFIIAMFSVGVAEELLFRAVIAQTLLEKFGTGYGGIWKACLLSGFLFSMAHMTNLLGSEPFGVLMQCVFTMALGTLLTAIYFRTGNIWVPVFLHGFMDVSSMIVGGLYGTQTVSEAVSGYDASMLLSVVIYILPVFFLLRRSRIQQVGLHFAPELAPAQEAEK